MKIKKILVAYDFSAPAVEALDAAIQVSKPLGAGLDLVHVIPFNAVAKLTDLVPHMDRMEEKMRESVEAEFEKVVGKLAHPAIATHVRIGHPAEEIAQLSKEGNYDLLVMGTHGRSAIAHFFLGSVTEKAIRLSPISTLVVRSGTSLANAKRILVALDTSPQGEKALALGKELASQGGAALAVVHSLGEHYYLPFYLQEAPEAFDGEVREMQEAEKAEIRARVEGSAPPALAPKLIFEIGPSPARSVLDCAKAEKSDLIVMGTHGRTGVDRFFLGSTAEQVLRYAPCSVLVVR